MLQVDQKVKWMMTGRVTHQVRQSGDHIDYNKMWGFIWFHFLANKELDTVRVIPVIPVQNLSTNSHSKIFSSLPSRSKFPFFPSPFYYVTPSQYYSTGYPAHITLPPPFTILLFLPTTGKVLGFEYPLKILSTQS